MCNKRNNTCNKRNKCVINTHTHTHTCAHAVMFSNFLRRKEFDNYYVHLLCFSFFISNTEPTDKMFLGLFPFLLHARTKEPTHTCTHTSVARFCKRNKPSDLRKQAQKKRLTSLTTLNLFIHQLFENSRSISSKRMAMWRVGSN